MGRKRCLHLWLAAALSAALMKTWDQQLSCGPCLFEHRNCGFHSPVQLMAFVLVSYRSFLF